MTEKSVREDLEREVYNVGKEMLDTALSPDNAEILYCLYVASRHTTEKTTPERLIELAGRYSPPNSLETVKSRLKHLGSWAFVKEEDGAYSLTDAGIIFIRFLASFSESVVNYDLVRDRLPKGLKDIYDRFTAEEREEYTKLYRRFRIIDEILEKGV